MFAILKRYFALAITLLLIAGAFFLYHSGFKNGAEKWKKIANQQKAKANAIKKEQQNTKEAKEKAEEYESEAQQQAYEDIEDEGYTSILNDGINDRD